MLNPPNLTREQLERLLGRAVSASEWEAYLVGARFVPPLERAERRPREQGEHRAR